MATHARSTLVQLVWLEDLLPITDAKNAWDVLQFQKSIIIPVAYTTTLVFVGTT